MKAEPTAHRSRWLDVHGVVAGTGTKDGALHFATVVLRYWQNVMVPDHCEVGKAESPPDRGRPEHLPQRFLNSILHPANLAPQRGESAAGRIEHRAPAIEAALDRDGNA